jgi:hypothetical protein
MSEEPVTGTKPAASLEVMLGLARVFAADSDRSALLLERIEGSPGGSDRAMLALDREFNLGDENPRKRPPAVIVSQVREMSDALGWGAPEGELDRLLDSAPEWPKGPLSFLGIRLRHGNHQEGVRLTMLQNIEAMRLAAESMGITHLFETPVEVPEGSLRLLGGARGHSHSMEWFAADLSTCVHRSSVTAIRSERSLADELFSLMWQYPEILAGIAHGVLPGMLAGGYRKKTPSSRLAMFVPGILPQGGSRGAEFNSVHEGNSDSRFTVPIRLDCLNPGALEAPSPPNLKSR